jgi:dTDP-4-dehydrorhamnose 3,5-epimerase
MQPNSDTNEIKLGLIDGVISWPAKSYVDLRGTFFKPFSDLDLNQFKVNFNTLEHFFTVSKKNVFRGMHFQDSPHSAAKIISIVKGRVIDYLLDLRPNSKTYLALQVIELSGHQPSSIYIPSGIAHGYLSLEDDSIVSYRQNALFCPNCDYGVSWQVIRDFLSIAHKTMIISTRDNELMGLGSLSTRKDCSN